MKIRSPNLNLTSITPLLFSLVLAKTAWCGETSLYYYINATVTDETLFEASYDTKKKSALAKDIYDELKPWIEQIHPELMTAITFHLFFLIAWGVIENTIDRLIQNRKEWLLIKFMLNPIQK
ncbi:hypothetical protein CI610_01497 [invertebrate metagenome]|uniref:Uncharacterized protein n=1 Tax=invertebrate metagenome TaxID=1711999 RepID=A0A2H9T8F7_9ZZZZ